MTPSEALDRVLDIATENCRYSEPSGTDVLREVLRRDWAVRVLDAHGDYRLIASKPASVRVHRGSQKTLIFWGGTPDAARLAAAIAIWPSLSHEQCAQLGPCPL